MCRVGSRGEEFGDVGWGGLNLKCETETNGCVLLGCLFCWLTNETVDAENKFNNNPNTLEDDKKYLFLWVFFFSFKISYMYQMHYISQTRKYTS